MLAAILRPGNAFANNAADHLEVFDLALEQLPREALDGPILARAAPICAKQHSGDVMAE